METIFRNMRISIPRAEKKQADIYREQVENVIKAWTSWSTFPVKLDAAAVEFTNAFRSKPEHSLVQSIQTKSETVPIKYTPLKTKSGFEENEHKNKSNFQGHEMRREYSNKSKASWGHVDPGLHDVTRGPPESGGGFLDDEGPEEDTSKWNSGSSIQNNTQNSNTAKVKSTSGKLGNNRNQSCEIGDNNKGEQDIHSSIGMNKHQSPFWDSGTKETTDKNLILDKSSNYVSKVADTLKSNPLPVSAFDTDVNTKLGYQGSQRPFHTLKIVGEEMNENGEQLIVDSMDEQIGGTCIKEDGRRHGVGRRRSSRMRASDLF